MIERDYVIVFFSKVLQSISLMQSELHKKKSVKNIKHKGSSQNVIRCFVQNVTWFILYSKTDQSRSEVIMTAV